MVMTSNDFFDTVLSRDVHLTKYSNGGKDKSINQSFWRVAQAVFHDNPDNKSMAYRHMSSGIFMPGGRIMAGAGTGNLVTLMNCYVMGTIEDSLDGIFENLKKGALTMQQGGGIGMNFSTLRP